MSLSRIITYNFILISMRELNFISEKIAEIGICNGMSAAFAVASLSGHLNGFLRTINYLVRLSKDVTDHKSSITEKVKLFKSEFAKREGIKEEAIINKKMIEKYHALSSDEQSIIDVLSLFSVISIFQDPRKYSRYLLHKKLEQSNFETISKIIQHKAEHGEIDLIQFYCKSLNKEGGLSQVYVDELMHTPIEWCGVLEEVRVIMEKYQKKLYSPNMVIILALQIEKLDYHAIALYYSTEEKGWILTDANHLPTAILRNMDDKYAHRILNGKPESKNLPLNAIFNNGFILDMQQEMHSSIADLTILSGHIQIFTTGKNPSLNLIKKEFSLLKEKERLYIPSAPLMLHRKLIKGESLLHKATMVDDIIRVKQFGKLGTDCNEENKDGRSPVYLAALYNSQKSMRFFVKNQHIYDINQVTQKSSSCYLLTPSHAAALRDCSETLEILAKAGANLNKTDARKHTPLHDATSVNALNVIKILIKPEYKVNLDMTNAAGNTPIFIAVRENNRGAVKLLADAGADLNKTQRDDKDAPLHLAVKNKSIETVSLLIQRNYKLDLNQVNSRGETAAFIASRSNSAAIFTRLAAHGADLQIAAMGFYGGYAPIHIAASYNSVDIIRILASNKFKLDINQQDKDGYTAANIASYKNHDEIIKLLAEAGADLQKPSKSGRTPLHTAIYCHALKVARVLLQPELKLNLNLTTNQGETFSMLAVNSNSLEILELLSKAGADLEKPTSDDITPLMQAIENGFYEIAKFLIKQSINLNAINKDGYTAAAYAAKYGNPELLELLSKNNADLNLGKQGISPFLAAVYGGSVKALNFLLKPEYKLDVNQTFSESHNNADKENHATAIIVAAAHSHYHLVEALAKAGANLLKTTNKGNAAIHWATNGNSTQSIRILIEYKADVNQRNVKGETAAFIAAENNKFKALITLTKLKADLSIRDSAGMTLLHCGAKNGHIEIVKFLLRQYSNPFALDSEKHSPIYYAIKNNHWDVVKLFIHVLNLNQLNIEDKRLILTHLNEIISYYFQLSAYSTKESEYSPIVTHLLESSFYFKKYADDFLIQHRSRYAQLQKEYDKHYAVVVFDKKANAPLSVLETKSPNMTINQDKFILTSARDTHASKGNIIKTLALSKSFRDEFIKHHPLTIGILKRERINPVAEEGFYSEEKRDHIGEYFLTAEFLALFVYYKIIKNSGKNYNNDNIYVLNDKKASGVPLIQTLKQLTLEHDGDNAKIIYISSIHAITIYLRNVKSQICCFIVDSQPNNFFDKTADIVAEALPHAKIFFSRAKLQLDYFSCSTFALKALMYFTKHGNNVFEIIDKPESVVKLNDHFFAVRENRLPAAFYKLSQKSTPEIKAYDEVVSLKNKRTITQYQATESVTFFSRTYNLAAIRKKYRYISQLENYMRNSISENNRALIQYHLNNNADTLGYPLDEIITDVSLPPGKRSIK